MARIQQLPKQRFHRWRPGETAALIDAWAPLYNRRSGGQTDMWVPRNQRGRARSFCDLVPEDWRAVAAAVNGYRAVVELNPDRTPDQCKRRMGLLRSIFGDELAGTSWWRRGAVDVGSGDDARSTLGGAAVDGITGVVAAFAAGGSDDAVVMAALGDFYMQLKMKKLEVELEMEKVKCAAEATRVGGSAGGLP